jgi:hypothetical protein
MIQLAWVLGLGIIGQLFFGSVGGTVGGALGYAIGLMMASPSPPQSSPDKTSPAQASPDQASPDSSSYDQASPNKTSTGQASGKDHGTEALRLFLLICILGGGFLFVRQFVWPGNNNDMPMPPTPDLPVEKLRPEVIPSVNIWSTPACLDQYFGQAISTGQAIPPEVTYFCAYPWQAKELELLIKALETHGVTSITILEQLKNPPPDIEQLIEYRKMTLDAPMPSSVRSAYQIFQILPLVWGAQQTKPGHLKVLNDYFKNDFVKKLMDASKDIKWSAQVTEQGLIREHDFDVEGESVRLFTSETVAVSIGEMAEIILGISGGESIQSSIKQKFPSNDNSLQNIASNLASQGLHAKHLGQLYLIESYILSLRSDAQKARANNELMPAFRPVDRQGQRQSAPLEIYWLKNAPLAWCGGASVTEAGQYCEHEDRVYSRVAAEATAGPGSVKSMFDGVGAVLLHELAHAYYNPQRSDDYPFVVEGLVTAFGERSMRAMLAAVPYMQSLNADILKFYSNAVGESSVVVQSAGGKHNKELDLAGVSKKYIATTDYTPYAKKAMCTLMSNPIEVEKVKAFLSMSNVTFRSQTVEHLNLAYAYGWGIFNFGLDAAELNASVSQEQRDASVVQRVAIAMKQNQKPDTELNTKLVDLTVDINALIKREFANRSIKCPKN